MTERKNFPLAKGGAQEGKDKLCCVAVLIVKRTERRDIGRRSGQNRKFRKNFRTKVAKRYRFDTCHCITDRSEQGVRKALPVFMRLKEMRLEKGESVVKNQICEENGKRCEVRRSGKAAAGARSKNSVGAAGGRNSFFKGKGRVCLGLLARTEFLSNGNLEKGCRFFGANSALTAGKRHIRKKDKFCPMGEWGGFSPFYRKQGFFRTKKYAII